jgi:SulP family sulfate permease
MQGRQGRRYQLGDLPKDAVAGVTLWAVFCAQGLAYARLAHATPAAGLVTGVAGAILYALVGSSLRISLGPAGGIAAIVGSVVAGVPAAHLPAALALLTLLVAAVQLLAGLGNAAFLTRLFPTPVFVGYIAGTGVTILIGQAHDLVSHGRFAFIVGAIAAAGVVLLRRLTPRVPGPFVVLVLATIASTLFDFTGRGVPVIGDSFGHFGALSLPQVDRQQLLALLGPAFSLGLVSYVDAIANANMLRERGDPPLRPRREFFALAALNAGAGLSGGFVAGCSTSRSLVGIRAGERSRLAPILAGVLLLLTGLSVVRLLRPLPLAALAGVVFVAAFDLIDWRRLREFWRLRHADLLAALAAAGGVILFGMIKGVLIGVVVALGEVLYRGMRPERRLFTSRSGEHLYEPFTQEAVRAAGDRLVYRFGAPIFFANAELFLEDMRLIAAAAPPHLHTVVINADALGVPDATARDSLAQAQRELADRNIHLEFGNARAPLRAALEKAGGFTLINEEQFLDDLRFVRGLRPGGPPSV